MFPNILEWIDRGLPTYVKGHAIPFSHDVDNSGTVNDRSRLREYIEFIDELHQPVLDIGGENWINEQIETQMKFRSYRTFETNFNDVVEAPRKDFGTIFCFEVVEHVMNPLNFMRDILRLTAPGGVVYLSTPRISIISIYHTEMHFTEYKESKLDTLFEYAGFAVEKKELFCNIPLWWAVTGFRPLFRKIFHRSIVYELRKSRNSANVPESGRPPPPA